jgi:hypothetical protein
MGKADQQNRQAGLGKAGLGKTGHTKARQIWCHVVQNGDVSSAIVPRAGVPLSDYASSNRKLILQLKRARI